MYVGWGETAVQDAATIWEGEGGLLWLLALLIGLLVAGNWLSITNDLETED